jgi:hypothetical protein
MRDNRLLLGATLAAKDAHALALASGHTPGAAFEIACTAYYAIQPETPMLVLQAIVAEGIGIWRRDRGPARDQR